MSPLGSLALAVGSVLVESSSFVRFCARFGSSFQLFGRACLESYCPGLDSALSKSASSRCCSTRFDSLLFAFGMSRLGSLTLVFDLL